MRSVGRLLQQTLLCTVAFVTLMTMHESMHWLAGRALGLGPHFTSVTSVGYRNDATDFQRLLVADLPVAAVFVVGVVSALLLSRMGTSLPEWFSCILVWWAVWGLSYPGDQANIAPLGSCFENSDFACLADWFHWTPAVRAGAAAVGAAWYLFSGWLIWFPRSSRTRQEIPATALRMILKMLAVLVALGMILILGRGMRSLALGVRFTPLPVLTFWAIVCALAIPWTRRSASRLLLEWVLPLVLADAVFFGWSHFQPSEYWIYPVIAVAPLSSALWRNSNVADVAIP